MRYAVRGICRDRRRDAAAASGGGRRVDRESGDRLGALGYPHNLNALLWGFVIGGAALTVTAASKLVMRALPRTGNPTAFGLTFVGAYATYELVLFAATPVLGGSGAFTPLIIGRLGVLSLLWLIGLVAACEIFRLAALLRRGKIFS